MNYYPTQLSVRPLLNMVVCLLVFFGCLLLKYLAACKIQKMLARISWSIKDTLLLAQI